MRPCNYEPSAQPLLFLLPMCIRMYMLMQILIPSNVEHVCVRRGLPSPSCCVTSVKPLEKFKFRVAIGVIKITSVLPLSKPPRSEVSTQQAT